MRQVLVVVAVVVQLGAPPPPMIITRWSRASPSSTLADWLRNFACGSPGTTRVLPLARFQTCGRTPRLPLIWPPE